MEHKTPPQVHWLSLSAFKLKKIHQTQAEISAEKSLAQVEA